MNASPRRCAACFLVVQSTIYILFLVRDLVYGGGETVLLKYTSIALCLLICVIWVVQGGDKMLVAAMALTLGADTCLLLLNRNYLLGVALFCGVQGLYYWRLHRANGGRSGCKARLCLFLLACFALWAGDNVSMLNILVAGYFTTFVCNTIQSMSVSGGRARLFSAGLVLFLCCDLCVAAYHLPSLVSSQVYAFAGFGMWLYYLPGQVLIALSGLPDHSAVEEAA